MSVRPHVVAPGPEETARVARAAFPKGNPYLILRDALGTLFQDDDVSDLYSRVNVGTRVIVLPMMDRRADMTEGKRG